MTIREAVDFLESSYRFGRKLGLENIRTLLRELGDPQRRLKVIHVAGTNGKGSVCASLYQMVREAGYSVGFYSSPHLVSYLERYRYNGKEMKESDFARLMRIVKEACERIVERGSQHPTEFEILTALAYLFFDEQGLEYAIMEVGLGGRLDATNAIEQPIATIITPLSLEHTEYLGDTMEKIAYEKAGIIKKGVPLITARQSEEAMRVIQERAAELHAPVYIAQESELLENSLEGIRLRYRGEEYAFALAGEHQAENASLALEAMRVMKEKNRIDISEEEIHKGLRHVHWPGRLERISAPVPFYIDGAHNPGAARVVAKMLKGKKVIGLLGMRSDKDVGAVLDAILPALSKVVATRPMGDTTLPSSELAAMIRERGKEAVAEEDIPTAVHKAIELCGPEDIVVSLGSFYLIGEVRRIFHPDHRSI